MDNLTQDEDINQVMIVDSSMETADESSERNVIETNERRMVRRYTIIDTTLAVRDIKVEDIVDGVVVGVNNYTKKTVVSKNTETFEDSSSSCTPSFVSSSSSSHRFADVSGSSVEERSRPVVRRSVVADINRASEEQAYVEKIVPQKFPLNLNNLISLNTFSPGPTQAGSYQGEFPSLGSSPPGNLGGKDSSGESLFKFPLSQYHLGQRHRYKKSARFSSSTSISEEDRLSLAGRSFIPGDISSIRQSVDASVNPLPHTSGEKTSPELDLHFDSPHRAECVSPSIISHQNVRGNSGQESVDLFSSSEEREKSFSLFPMLTDKSDSKESSGDSMNVPVVGDSPHTTDIIPPTESEASDGAGLPRKVRRPRLPLRRYSLLRRLPTVVGSPSDVRPELQGGGQADQKTLKHGTLVYTRWTDGHFYPGQVDRVIDPGDGDDAGKFSVLFDDGHLYEANRCDIIVCDLVPMSSSVMADRSESDLTPQAGPSTPRGKRGRWSEVAEVVGHTSRADGSKSYLVKFKDGKEVFAERKKVTLTLAQAGRVFGWLIKSVDLHRSLRLSPDVSTDNLVEGKRKRRPPTPLSQSDQWEFPAGSMTSPKRKKTKMMRRSKVVLSTPRANKRKYTGTKARTEPYDPCPPVVICSPSTHHKPVGSRKSAKRALSYVTNVKSNIFSSLTFLITHVWKSPSQLERERALMEGETLSTSCYTSSPEVPPDAGIKLMNRDLVVGLIREGGGTILEDFSLEAVSKCRNTCYLVSDSPQRTIKYLCCLAFGIPCVSYQWIVGSSNQDKLENYNLYLLPVGYSIERNLILTRDHHQGRPSPLEGLQVLVRLKGNQICAAWKKVLVAAGCRVAVVREEEALESHLKTSVSKTYLVTDSSLLGVEKEGAVNMAGVELVSTEWVVQCIINEKILDPDGSPKYKP